MKDATIFILDSGSLNSDPNRLKKSLLGLNVDILEVPLISDFSTIQVDTPWKGFFYSDEYLQRYLSEALPAYFNSFYDVLCCFQWKKSSMASVGHSPRLFRNYVELLPDAVQVKSMEGLKWLNILDGFIYRD
jgi:hypothetical protein